MTELPPEQILALAYAQRAQREPFASLLLFDRILGKSVASASASLLGQIRLAWWREQVAALPSEHPGPDPVLGALDGLIRNHEVKKGCFVDLVNGWETLLDDSPLSDDRLVAHAGGRGGALFRLASAVSGTAAGEEIERAGTLWALVDFARHCSDRALAGRALALATQYEGAARLLPRGLRPFAILTRFAERDTARGLDRLTPTGSPRRILQAWAFVSGLV